MSNQTYKEGIRLRFFYVLDKIKNLHDLTDANIANKLGYTNSTNLSQIKIGKREITLEYIMQAYYAFPKDFNLMYVLTDPDMTEIQYTSFKGLRGNGKSGRKPKNRPANRKVIDKPENRIKSYWDTI